MPWRTSPMVRTLMKMSVEETASYQTRTCGFVRLSAASWAGASVDGEDDVGGFDDRGDVGALGQAKLMDRFDGD